VSDISCPYCGHEQEICHDDGFGYEEGVKHKIECYQCEKPFFFYTTISFIYEPRCADGKCDFERPMEQKHPHFFHCKNCENSYIETD
jgi:hypothetical protein